MATLSTVLQDRILDSATKAAISQAETDFPKPHSKEELVQIATDQCTTAFDDIEPDELADAIAMYVGIFSAAYALRHRVISSAPSSNHQNHALLRPNGSR